MSVGSVTRQLVCRGEEQVFPVLRLVLEQAQLVHRRGPHHHLLGRERVDDFGVGQDLLDLLLAERIRLVQLPVDLRCALRILPDDFGRLAERLIRGANDLRIYAMPVDRMLAAMKKYGRLP